MKKFNTLTRVIFTLACLVNASAFGMHAGPSGAEGTNDTVTFIANDNKKHVIPKSVAYEFQNIRAIIAPSVAGTPSVFADEHEITLGYIDSATFGTIAELVKAIQRIKPYALEWERAGVQPFVTPRQIQPVVNAILAKLTRQEIAALMQAEDFLDIPILRNALASYIVDDLVKGNSELTKDTIADELKAVFGLKISLSSTGMLAEMRKHLVWKMDDVFQELCIADLIHESGMPRIDQRQRLDLSANELTSLDGLQLIQGLNTAQNLDIGDNQLQTLPPNIFNALVNLQRLWLDNNQLQTLPPNIFNALGSLQNLHLEENQLQTLPPNIFNALVNLQNLNLADNQLQTLPPNIFNALVNLQNLNLADNQLQTLHPNIFNALGNLQWLRFSDNQLQTLPPNIFNALVYLQMLWLGNNQLQTLPPNIFNALVNLQELWLRNNSLPPTTIIQIQQALPHARIYS